MTSNVPPPPSGQQLPTAAVLVIGGGISGMQSALDLANAGIKVYLVETLSGHRRQDGPAG
jgi:heterodisulfide reductase subunit A2